MVLFPAINTSEHRAGHVKQAHRKRWACFTFSYSPWSGSTGQGIKNPRAVFVVWGTQLGYNDGVHSVPHTCTPSLYSTGDVKICTASFRLNARTSRHMGVCFGWTPPQNPKGQRRPHRNRHVGVPISRWGGNFRRLPPTRFNSPGRMFTGSVRSRFCCRAFSEPAGDESGGEKCAFWPVWRSERMKPLAIQFHA